VPSHTSGKDPAETSCTAAVQFTGETITRMVVVVEVVDVVVSVVVVDEDVVVDVVDVVVDSQSGVVHWPTLQFPEQQCMGSVQDAAPIPQHTLSPPHAHDMLWQLPAMWVESHSPTSMSRVMLTSLQPFRQTGSKQTLSGHELLSTPQYSPPSQRPSPHNEALKRPWARAP